MSSDHDRIAALEADLENERQGRLLHESIEARWRDKATALEAELAEANIAVGLTGYDHRPDINTPSECIYALWADHTALRKELAATREREAALAAALEHFNGALRLTIPINPRLAGLDIDPAAILARVRHEAKREALEKLPMREVQTPGPDGWTWGQYVSYEDIHAALAALDAEEKKGEQR